MKSIFDFYKATRPKVNWDRAKSVWSSFQEDFKLAAEVMVRFAIIDDDVFSKLKNREVRGVFAPLVEKLPSPAKEKNAIYSSFEKLVYNNVVPRLKAAGKFALHNRKI